MPGGLDDSTAGGAGSDACPCGCGSCGRARNCISRLAILARGEQGECDEAILRCGDLLNDLGSRANAVSEVVRLGKIVYGEPATVWRLMKLLVVVPGCT